MLRAIFLTPYALPVYASVITWAFMFQYNNGLVNDVLHNELGITSRPTFWLLGDNSFFALVIVSVWRNWPFAFLVRHGGAAVHPARAVRGLGDRRGRDLAADPADHDAVAAAVNQVLVLVLFLWTFNDFTTPFVLFGNSAPQPGGRHLDPHLQRLVPHLELRRGLSDVRAAAALPAAGYRRLPARHVPPEEANA